MKPDHRNWVPKNMVVGLGTAAALALVLLLLPGATGAFPHGTARLVCGPVFGVGALVRASGLKKRWDMPMKTCGADYEMIVGEGMFHCYPVFPICKEAKDGWAMMVRKMKENTAS